jgi:hypothetical protein
MRSGSKLSKYENGTSLNDSADDVAGFSIDSASNEGSESPAIKRANELFTFLGFWRCLSEGFRTLVPMILELIERT